MKKKIYVLSTIFILLFTGLAYGQGLNFSINTGMEEALTAINADIFRKEYSVDGDGIKIAIIDTGVDVSHPDLQTTSHGEVKVVDYIDFTDEGYVDTKTKVIPQDGSVTYNGKLYNVAGISTRCGTFHIGIFNESQIEKNSPLGQDANRNGKTNEKFGVLVTDSVLPGIYDTVYVDTNLNFDFSDEKPLKLYSRNHQWGTFGKDNPMTDYIEESSFAITDIGVRGNNVNFSFDGNGHGTHVAGIIGANGQLVGTAPGAQIIAIKAIGSSGDGNWENIFKAIEYARKNGADIINVSIGDLILSEESHIAQLRLLKKLSLESNAVLVMAAGNRGPGVGTAYDTGSSDNIITVGAYMSPKLWDINYNVIVPGETLQHYSGVGNGSYRPTVVAPSSVISTVNRWDGIGYYLMDGTSMAVPYVSGGLALLMEKARMESMPISASKLKRSIESGARRIDGYLEIEQGSGLLDLVKSWEALKDTQTDSYNTNISVNLPETPGHTEGIFFRDNLKGQIQLQLTNMSSTQKKVILEPSEDWVKINDNSEVVLSRGKPQPVTLLYDYPENPGLYTATTFAKDADTNKPIMDFMTAAVVPYDLSKKSNVTIYSSILPSRWERYFFKTVPGMSELNITLEVLEQDMSLGRSIIYIYEPNGQKVYEEVVGSDYISTKKSTSFKQTKPASGIWEVVVVSDYNLSDFGAKTTTFQLTAQAFGIFTDVRELAFSPQEDEQNYISREILLKNGNSIFNGRIEGLGMAEKNEGISTTNMTVKNGEFTKGPVINIPANTMSLSIDIIPQRDEGDVDLYLYKKNNSTGLYEEAAYSAKIDVSKERIDLTRPEPGEYVIYVDGLYVPEGAAEYTVKTQVLRDHMNVYVQNVVGQLNPGQQWKSRLYINIPPLGSEFIGFIAVKNDMGDEISQIPLKLIIGKRPLKVDVIQKSHVLVREKGTNNPVNTNILINGIEYPVVKGKAIIPDNINIRTIEGDDGNFAPFIIRLNQ